MSRRTLVLVAAILGSSMAFVDATVVNVALPTIGRELGFGLAGRQWVYLAYSLALAGLYLPAGAVGDRFGRRGVFVGGTAAFAAASALAGASPSTAVLLVARTLQGAAAAFVSTTSLALLRATFREESGRAVGLWTAWTGIATIVGPPLGGALTQYASWRYVFFLNLPLAAAAAVLAQRYAREEPAAREARFDVLGAVLLAAGLTLLTYTLVEQGPWWLLAPAAGVLAAAFAHEARTDAPMLPLPLFRLRLFAAANAETFLVYAALSASTFYVVLYLQSVVGYSPLQASLVLLPVSAVMLLLAGRFGRLADTHGPRLYLAVGPALLAGGILLWELVASSSDWPALAAGTLLFSLGLAVTVAPITAAALGSVPEQNAGVAAGVNNTVSRIGGLVAVAIVGLVVSLVGGELTVASFRAGMTVAAGLALAGSAVAVGWVPGRAPRARRAVDPAGMR